MPLLGAAIFDSGGGMERALDILAQALDESRVAGDRAAEASAWALHQLVVLRSVSDTDLDSIQRELEACAPEIEQFGDVRTLVCLRRLELDIALTRLVGLEAAADRLLAAARGCHRHTCCRSRLPVSGHCMSRAIGRHRRRRDTGTGALGA